MYNFYERPTTLDEALTLKAKYGDKARIIAGGTDLLIELDRGVRPASDGGGIGLIDISSIPGLADINTVPGKGAEDGSGEWIEVGPLVTHNQCVASHEIVAKAFPLARACWEVGAPQIRNRATLAGNIVTASPANDTIAPLLALNAQVTVTSAARGDRTLPLAGFMTGFRQVDLADDEILTRIAFPAMSEDQRGTYIKLGLRRAQAISIVSLAIVLDFDSNSEGSTKEGSTGNRAQRIRSASIGLGAVAPTIVRATAAEAYLAGKALTEEVIAEAATLALDVATPIDDVRATADYRHHMVKALVARGLRQIERGQERAGWSDRPITLWGETDGKWPVANKASAGQIATVNGEAVALSPQMTLLDSLRDAGFLGVKEGCAEGECGSCTVTLDGMAVMACMVPSERALGSHVVTVEGVGNAEKIHPVQQAFVDSGGVQCGYCTPGFIVSAATLLEERPQPTRGEVQEALTGNLCRCTGYRKIIDAVVAAGEG